MTERNPSGEQGEEQLDTDSTSDTLLRKIVGLLAPDERAGISDMRLAASKLRLVSSTNPNLAHLHTLGNRLDQRARRLGTLAHQASVHLDMESPQQTLFSIEDSRAPKSPKSERPPSSAQDTLF